MPCLQKSWFPYRKLTFCPKYPNLWVRFWHFLPTQLIWATPVNVVNTERVSHRFPDMRIPNVLLHPPQKLNFWPKSGKSWPKIGIFGKIWAFLVHFIQCLTKKTSKRLPRCFFCCVWGPKLLLPTVIIWIFGPERPNLVHIMHFWSCLTKKQCK